MQDQEIEDERVRRMSTAHSTQMFNLRHVISDETFANALTDNQAKFYVNRRQ